MAGMIRDIISIAKNRIDMPSPAPSLFFFEQADNKKQIHTISSCITVCMRWNNKNSFIGTVSFTIIKPNTYQRLHIILNATIIRNNADHLLKMTLPLRIGRVLRMHLCVLTPPWREVQCQLGRQTLYDIIHVTYRSL